MATARTRPDRPDSLVWWPFTALLLLVVASVLSAAVAISSAPRAIAFQTTNIANLPINPNTVGDFGISMYQPGAPKFEVESVNFVAVKGFPIPARYEIVAAVPPVTSSRGWPPIGPSGKAATIYPIAGLLVNPDSQMGPIILIGVDGGAKPETYAWAGINLTYELDGTQLSSTIWEGGVLCVTLTTGCDFDTPANEISKMQPAS